MPFTPALPVMAPMPAPATTIASPAQLPVALPVAQPPVYAPVPSSVWQSYQPSMVAARPQPVATDPTLAAIQQLPGAQTMPPELVKALHMVAGIQPFPGMREYAKSMGIDVIFNNGAEALNHILKNRINVVFGDMGDTTAHAQWITDQNTIMINQKYRGDASPTMIYALSEAIFHEAGHATRRGDGQSSVQEETNCLFLNAWANYVHQLADPAYANSTQNSELLSNGVALYTKLFFQDPDPEKNALVRRIALKYGVLPMYSPDHGPIRTEKVPVPGNLNPGWWMGLPSIASRVVRYVHDENAVKLFGPQA